MTALTRRAAAAFDAIAMIAAAVVLTGGRFSDARADPVLWGSAVAAVVAALVVLAGDPALLA